MKKLLQKLIRPKQPYGVLLGLVLVALGITAVVLQPDIAALAYLCYMLSAYGLALLIANAVVPLVRRIIQWLRSNPYIDRYYTDPVFNARVSLYRGLILNVCYAVFKLAVGIWSRSVWFIAIAVYYVALSAIKFVLVRNDLRAWRGKQSSLLQEWSAYRTAGWMLFLLNMALTGMIILVVWRGNSYSYPGFIIFAMAFYAFYRITLAAIRLLRGRKERAPVFSAAKIIDFIFAVVAMFTLQTAMLSTFGSEDHRFIAVFNSAIGIAVSMFVLAAAVFMLIRAHREIAHTKEMG